jgi:hypothetical protein
LLRTDTNIVGEGERVLSVRIALLGVPPHVLEPRFSCSHLRHRLKALAWQTIQSARSLDWNSDLGAKDMANATLPGIIILA